MIQVECWTWIWNSFLLNHGSFNILWIINKWLKQKRQQQTTCISRKQLSCLNTLHKHYSIQILNKLYYPINTLIKQTKIYAKTQKCWLKAKLIRPNDSISLRNIESRSTKEKNMNSRICNVMNRTANWVIVEIGVNSWVNYKKKKSSNTRAGWK